MVPDSAGAPEQSDRIVGSNHEIRPKLRPVEAFRLPADGKGADTELIGLRDSCGLSEVVLTMSVPALQILALMDGTRSRDDILACFERLHRSPLKRETLDTIIHHLEAAHLLEGPAFEVFYDALVQDYLALPARTMPHAAALGIDPAGSVFDRMLVGVEPEPIERTICGVIAPHLDYERGAPCYASAYGALRARQKPNRVVILGTNHFGRGTSVVATAKDFATPLGTAPTDRAFIESLEARVGSLRTHELDHAREHSVELQVAWLQYLYGEDTFSIVPVLCHDPCGPTGTSPYDGCGVDLRHFAEALGALIAEDSADTLVVAGADLSHIGATFGDERRLDDSFLDEVRNHDQTALARLERSGADEFVDVLRAKGNETRVCSAGCIFAATVALADARPELVNYHQAVDQDTQNCVTCCAVVFS